MSGLLHCPDDHWRAPRLCVSDDGGPPLCAARTAVPFPAHPGPAARRPGVARSLCATAPSRTDGVRLGARPWWPLASPGVAGPERGAPQREGHPGDPSRSTDAGILGRDYPPGRVSATAAELGRENAGRRNPDHPVRGPSRSASRGGRATDLDRGLLSAGASRVTPCHIPAEAPMD